MPLNIEVVILIGIAAVVLLGFIAYYGARFLKGRLTLELSSNTVDSKQTLPGTVTVVAKKNINGLLIVSLVGQMLKTRRTSKGSKSEWVDVFRQDTVLEEQRDFPVGFTQQYEFTFDAPTASQARSGQSVLRAMADKVGGTVGTLLSLGANITQGRIRWHVEARLDATGVDLYAKRRITINLRD